MTSVFKQRIYVNSEDKPDVDDLIFGDEDTDHVSTK